MSVEDTLEEWIYPLVLVLVIRLWYEICYDVGMYYEVFWQ
jgi:hypothetical protein